MMNKSLSILLGKVPRLTQAIVYLAIVASLAGCGQGISSGDAAAPITSTPPQVEVTILPPMTEAPLRECMPYPGVNLEALSTTPGEINVKITGLEPNERVTFVFYSEAAGQTFKIESNPLEGADSNGSLEYVESLGRISEGPLKKWQVQVIHSRGVACTMVSLP
jgi:hypothetical protein